uniref:Reverse transcriptase domain-containing protein n=1 Tax=Tanacetum cinerariifolium TaxID=118510 RepID=A0A6L2LFH1_TANCI|nr:hypothetical protein [Tanacetum cinerariifolium]
MEAIQAFLKKYDHIPHREKGMALLLAEERFLKVKKALEEGQNQPKNVQELLLKLLNDLQILNKMQLKQEEQAAKICTPYWKCPIFDDDDDEEYTIQVREYYKNSLVATTPDFPITDSLIIEDEHLDTISETESDEENKSSVEDLNLTPSESEDLFDIESECDVPVCDAFTTFCNPLFDSYDDSTSSDDESFSDKDEFSGELAHIDLISPEIDEADFDPEEEIHLVEKLLYDNSSPQPPKELNSENSEAVIESFSSSPILVEGSDSLKEDIDFFLLRMTRYHHPRILPTQPTLYVCPVIDTLLLFSSENEEKVFNLGILASKEEKSPHHLSHWGFKAFQLISNFSKSPMLIYGWNIPILDVPFLHFYPPKPAQVRGIEIALDYDDSRARGFVLHSLEFQSLA